MASKMAKMVKSYLINSVKWSILAKKNCNTPLQIVSWSVKLYRLVIASVISIGTTLLFIINELSINGVVYWSH